MSLLRKLAGETAIYGISSILGRIINWVLLTPYLTRVFVPEEYGVVNDLYFYVALLLVLFTYRMETALFRFASRERREDGGYDRAFTTASLSVAGSTIILTALLVAAAPAIADWLKYPDRTQYVILFLFIVALDALAAIPFARLRLDGRPLRFAFIRVLSILLNIIFVFFFLEICPWLLSRGHEWVRAIYYEEYRVGYVFAANLLASLGTLVLLVPLYFRHTPGAPGAAAMDEPAPDVPVDNRYFDRSLWRRMVLYSLPLVISGVAGIINSLAGVPLLKYLGGGSVSENLRLAGIFAAASKLAVLMNLFIQAYNYAAEPFFFKQSAASEDRAIYADATRAFALIGAIAFLGIMLFIDLIQFFLGAEYREGLGVLPILLAANFFLGLFYNFSISYKLTDQTHLGGYIAVVGMIITFGLNFLLIPMPSVSYYGPAWATLACYVFMAMTAWLVSRRYMPIPYRLDKIFGYLLIALAGYGLSYWLQARFGFGIWTGIGINTFILLISLAALLWFDWEWLRRVVKRKG